MFDPIKMKSRFLVKIALILLFGYSGLSYSGSAAAACSAAPTLQAPQGAVQNGSPVFQWTGNPECTWHQFYIRGETGGPGLLPSIRSSETNCASDSSCEATLVDSLGAGQYNWWIRSWDPVNGSFTPWSTSNSFEINGDCAVMPTAVSPRGPVTEMLPTMRWTGSSSCTYYLLAVRDEAGAIVYQPWITATAAGCSGGTDCEVTPSTVLDFGSYTWTLRGWSPSEVNGQTSAPTDFIVSASNCTSPPTLLAPTGTHTGVTPTYSWKRDDGCSWYRIWVSDPDGSQAYAPWFTASSAACSSATGACEVTLPIALTGGQHRVWLMGWSQANAYTAWSNANTFNINDNCPLCPPAPPES